MPYIHEGSITPPSLPHSVFFSAGSSSSSAMPPNVVDAFKSSVHFFPHISFSLSVSLDLIRHGKHHHAARSEAVKNHDEQNTQRTQANSRASCQQEQGHTVTQPTQGVHYNVRHDQESMKPPPAREIVQTMVDEEREKKLKMPVYKGLEDYRLLEKMGE